MKKQKEKTSEEVASTKCYVDKAKFYEALKEYAEIRDKKFEEFKEKFLNPAIEEAKAKGEEPPTIKDEKWKTLWMQYKPTPSNYIGECFLKIADHLSRRPNFFGYTYKEDFVGEAVLNCINYIDNFDPTKSKNPFGYFTTLCWYCFIQIIGEEKHQSIVKGNIMMQNLNDEFLTLDNEDDEFSSDDSVRNSHTFVELAYQEKVRREQEDKEKKEEKLRKKEEAANKTNLSFLFD